MTRQLILFDGLEYGHNNRPTDVDMVFEYHDGGMAFGEYKYDGASLPKGQILTLTRLARACGKAGKVAYALIIDHHTWYDHDVDASTCIVRQIYDGRTGVWTDGNGQTVKQFIDRFVKEVDGRDDV